MSITATFPNASQLDTLNTKLQGVADTIRGQGGLIINTDLDVSYLTESGLANHVVTEYNGASLAGSNQTVKQAIDGLNSNIALTVLSSSLTGKEAIISYMDTNTPMASVRYYYVSSSQASAIGLGTGGAYIIAMAMSTTWKVLFAVKNNSNASTTVGKIATLLKNNGTWLESWISVSME